MLSVLIYENALRHHAPTVNAPRLPSCENREAEKKVVNKELRCRAKNSGFNMVSLILLEIYYAACDNLALPRNLESF